MSSFYQALAVFFFLVGSGCLITCVYLWKPYPLIHINKLKRKQTQRHVSETVILTEEWEECLWKSTNHNDSI